MNSGKGYFLGRRREGEYLMTGNSQGDDRFYIDVPNTYFEYSQSDYTSNRNQDYSKNAKESQKQSNKNEKGSESLPTHSDPGPDLKQQRKSLSTNVTINTNEAPSKTEAVPEDSLKASPARPNTLSWQNSEKTDQYSPVTADDVRSGRLDKEEISVAENVHTIYQHVVNGNIEQVKLFLKLYPHRVSLPNSEGYHLANLAAINSHKEILVILSQCGTGLAVSDPEGKTPLHHAIIADSPDIVALLLEKQSNIMICDNAGMLPLHTAAEMGNEDIMNLLLPFYRNLNVKVEGGQTALHLAAINNHSAVIRRLIKEGASPMIKDDNGNYPIHSAAKNAAYAAIQAIVEESIALGYERNKLMALKDRERNMPIHSAVNSGNIQTVKVCLKAGGKVVSRQEDGSTPIHFAAAQGNLELVKVMFDMQPDLFKSGLENQDVLHRTALHWATIFNYEDMMTFLIEKGARVNASDVEESTPLHIAASIGSMKAMQLLVENNADPHRIDKNNRNFLHLFVMSMEIVPEIKEFLKSVKMYQKLIKARDCYGFTPFHYAVKFGNLSLLNDLLKLSTAYNLKSNKRQTIFHLAAQFGRYNSCLAILATPKGLSLKNEPDELGMTPLHLAAMCGQNRTVAFLLNKGVSVCKDNDNNTPLHLAAAKGRVECMNTLLLTHKNLLDMTNADGNTALILAAAVGHVESVVLLLTVGARITRNNNNRCFYDEIISRKHQDVAIAIVQHARWDEVFQFLSVVYGTFMIGLIQYLPHVSLMVLDRCVVQSDQDVSSADYYVEYNFTYLNLPLNFPWFANNNKLRYLPLLPLQTMVDYSRVECLSHPLCSYFLRMKWRKYGIHLQSFEIGVHFMHLVALTFLIVRLDSMHHDDKVKLSIPGLGTVDGGNDSNVTPKDDANNTNVTTATIYPPFPDRFESADEICLYLLCIYSIMGLVKEFLLMLSMCMNYFSIQRVLELSVYASAFFFALPLINRVSTHVQWECASICIFVSWFNCLVNLQRFDLFGIYIVMFLEIMKTLIQVVLLFSVLNVAFGLAFYVLLQHDNLKANRTPIMSIYRTLIFLIEFDFHASFSNAYQDNDPDTLHFGNGVYILLAVFILLMNILLINLLIGLAVGDIESVQKGARLKRLATQVEFHSRAEGRLPFLAKLTDEKYVHYPNKVDKNAVHAYHKMVGIRDSFSEEDTFVGRQLINSNNRLNHIANKIEKSNVLMNRIMKRLHMNTEEEIWDEGGTVIEGMGEPEESKSLRPRLGKPRDIKRMKSVA